MWCFNSVQMSTGLTSGGVKSVRTWLNLRSKASLVASNSKIAAMLAWRPEVSLFLGSERTTQV